AKNKGIPDDSCQNYLGGISVSKNNCGAADVCQTCLSGTCTAATPTLYKVSQYGSVAGADRMKPEIFPRGPIGCGISVTSNFLNYTTGIYEEWLSWPSINHEIAVVGWGAGSDGTEYWIGRNSWGSYWGEEGFFRIKMYENNLGIETNCDWG